MKKTLDDFFKYELQFHSEEGIMDINIDTE